MTDSTEAFRDRLRAALAEGPPLRLAVLFGSQATGRARAGSDCDVGIIPVDSGLTLHDELALASALSAAVSCEIDLVRLDDDAPLLGAEVARTVRASSSLHRASSPPIARTPCRSGSISKR